MINYTYYFLHIFSLKTPILGRFHQRKVTVPCAFSMRKGVTRIKKSVQYFYIRVPNIFFTAPPTYSSSLTASIIPCAIVTPAIQNPKVRSVLAIARFIITDSWQRCISVVSS